jgi:hypothetical protein
MAKASSKAKQAKIGRPSKFDPAFVEQARKLALLRATDEEMADFWDISVPTLHAWRKAHPEFLKATKEGKLIADAEIAESLFHRAKGYSHPAVKIFNDRETGVTQVPYTEHYPPDTTAASLWLRNRQPDKWRDKVEVDQKHTLDPDILGTTPLELARGLAFVLALGQRDAGAAPAAPAAPPMKH